VSSWGAERKPGGNCGGVRTIKTPLGQLKYWYEKASAGELAAFWSVGISTPAPGTAAQALDLEVTEAEELCADLVAAGTIERAPMQ
jgi:hypothetical protein